MKYLCHCGKEISILILGWQQYKNAHSGDIRPLCIYCKLYCQDCGKEEHELLTNDLNGWIDVFHIHLSTATKERALTQLWIQILSSDSYDSIKGYYLPKTDLKKALSQIRKVNDASIS